MSKYARVVAISVDLPQVVRTFVDEQNLAFDVALDRDGRATQRYGLMSTDGGAATAIPATIVLDSDGYVRWFHVSESVRVRPDADKILDVLRKLDG